MKILEITLLKREIHINKKNDFGKCMTHGQGHLLFK